MLWYKLYINFIISLFFSKELLLGRFAANQLPASRLTVANCLFYIIYIHKIDFIKLKDLLSRQRILEAKILYLWIFTSHAL